MNNFEDDHELCKQKVQKLKEDESHDKPELV